MNMANAIGVSVSVRVRIRDGVRAVGVSARVKLGVVLLQSDLRSSVHMPGLLK